MMAMQSHPAARHPCPSRPLPLPLPPLRLQQARHDGQAARTQLQLAAKAGLSFLDEFFQFKTKVGAGYCHQQKRCWGFKRCWRGLRLPLASSWV